MRKNTHATLIVLLGLTLLLYSCSGLPLSFNNECQANTSRLMASNRVPEGDQIKRGSYSGNTNEGIHFLTLGTELNPGELLEHYNDQTIAERTDWILLNSESTEYTAWSSWSVTDECGDTWDGLISITQPQSTIDPFVTIRIKKG